MTTPPINESIQDLKEKIETLNNACAELSEDLMAGFNAIFPYVPEACDQEGEMLSLADKITILAGKTRFTDLLLSNFEFQNARVKDSGVVVGSYVFASRWGDASWNDPSAVGFVKEFKNDYVVVVDAFGKTIGHPSWPRCSAITAAQGNRIRKEYHPREGTPFNKTVAACIIYGLPIPGDDVLYAMQSLEEE